MNAAMKGIYDTSPKEAWTLIGIDAQGNFYCSRFRVGGLESSGIGDLKEYQLRWAAFNNRGGASLRVVHERLDENCLWQEVSE